MSVAFSTSTTLPAPSLNGLPISNFEALCGICSTVDFDKYLGKQLTKPIKLGTWKSIIASQDCAFCRLVVQALQSDASLTPSDSHANIYLDNQPSWELGVEFSPYDRKRLDINSNLADLRICQRQCRDMAFRFLVFTTQSGRMDRAQIQYLAHMERDPLSRQFFGRPVAQDKVDLETIKMWLGKCRKYHSGSCERSTIFGALPKEFRLLDVVHRRIVRVSPSDHPSYVALSYVWGRTQMKFQMGSEPITLRRKDLKTVKGRELPTPLPRKLPTTIEDAIWLTKNLGFEFLWVDALCIPHDDPWELKAVQMAHMPAIYSKAYLTIAAGSSIHADSGLPGVGPPRKFAQYSERIKGLRLACMFPSYTKLEKSSVLPWNSRTWTLPEKVLSKRILLFTEYQVYFKCSEAICSEEVNMETGPLSTSPDSRPGKFRWDPASDSQFSQPGALARTKSLFGGSLSLEDELRHMESFRAYADVVNQFTGRMLSDPKDTLFAVQGLLHKVQECTGRMMFALPELHILDSLAWMPEPGSILLRTPMEGLPSWTWTAYQFRNLKALSFSTSSVSSGASYYVQNDHLVREFMLRHNLDDSSAAKDLIESAGHRDRENWVLQTLIEIFSLLPMLVKGHTIEQITYSHGGHCRKLEMFIPLSSASSKAATSAASSRKLSKAITSFIPETNATAKSTIYKFFNDTEMPFADPILNTISITAGKNGAGKKNKKVNKWGVPALVFKTSVVSFRVGKVIKGEYKGWDDETALFELCDQNGFVVGEVATTFGAVKRTMRPRVVSVMGLGPVSTGSNSPVMTGVKPINRVPVPNSANGTTAATTTTGSGSPPKASAAPAPTINGNGASSSASASASNTTLPTSRILASTAEFLTLSWAVGVSTANVHEKFVPRWKKPLPPVPFDDPLTNSLSNGSHRRGVSMSRKNSYLNGSATNTYTAGTGRSSMTAFERMSRRWSFVGSSHGNGSEKRSTSLVKMSPSDYRRGSQQMEHGADYNPVADPALRPLNSVVGSTPPVSGSLLPRELWPVVSLVFISWDGGRASRLGAGRVIMSAWEEAKTFGQEVIFV